MVKHAERPRNAKTGRFLVHSKGKEANGVLIWEIRDSERSTKKVVKTSPASAATIQGIKKKHSKALERLAKK